ncbi:MAG: hypothetical protein LBT93_08390, partial [Treponema sp.]|nr:hypothetical protein [Treponema sp.]
MNRLLKSASAGRGQGKSGKGRVFKARFPAVLFFLVLTAAVVYTACSLDTESLGFPGSWGGGNITGGSGPGGVGIPGGNSGSPSGSVDTDGDGYPDDWERAHGTDPNDPNDHPDTTPGSTTDSDGDGLPDWWELEHNLDPTDSAGNNGANGDPDNDGLTNKEEYDGDPDWLDDRTDPNLPDTDGDGYPDGWEAENDYDPTDPNDHPDTTPGSTTDSAGDGLPDWWELEHNLDPTDSAGNNGANGDPDND